MTAPAVTGPRRRRLAVPRRWLRGALAVAALLVSAADALISALTGWAPVGRTIRQLAAPIADAWHRGARTVPPPRVYITHPAREDTTDDQ